MKVTALGHASLLIEAGGVSVLSDPWWEGGSCFGGTWWIYPPPDLTALPATGPDYIYVSHGHADHLHVPTLRTLPRRARVLVSAASDLAAPIRALGFEVVELGDDEHALAPGVGCRIMPTEGDDTLMALRDGTEVVVNANDALHACVEEVQEHFARRLRALYPAITYLFCGYGTASHFPNCYRVPGKDDAATAARRQRHFNRSWARLVRELAPTYACPFAADVVLLDQALAWANEPVHNAQRPTEAFHAPPGSPTTTVDIAPGFAVERGRIVRDRRRQPVRAEEVEAHYRDAIQRVNRHAPVEPEAFDRVASLFRARVEQWLPYLTTGPHDYRILVRLHGSEAGLELVKRGKRIVVAAVPAPDVGEYEFTYTTRLAYLRGALTTPHGWEVLFVGSGGVFEYRSAANLRLHEDFARMLRPGDCPPPRPALSAARMVARTAVKRLLGRREPDLYSLAAWTEFVDGASGSAATAAAERSTARTRS